MKLFIEYALYGYIRSMGLEEEKINVTFSMERPDLIFRLIQNGGEFRHTFNEEGMVEISIY